jgi:hypothetical protein
VAGARGTDGGAQVAVEGVAEAAAMRRGLPVDMYNSYTIPCSGVENHSMVPCLVLACINLLGMQAPSIAWFCNCEAGDILAALCKQVLCASHTVIHRSETLNGSMVRQQAGPQQGPVQ